MAGDKESTLVFKVDGTQAETGVAKVKRSLHDLADTASREGQRGAAGIAGMGAGAEKSAAQIERSTQRQIGEIRRMTAELESGGKATRAYQEAMASIRGVDTAALRPYLDQLEQARTRMAGLGATSAQTANQMRMVAPQITDIVTQLASGQSAFTIFIQQGGQLKDMFGGVGVAAKALGTYVLGLINPFTLAAGAAALLATAYYQGSKESAAYNTAIVMSGNAAGVTAGQLGDMARAMQSATRTQSAASAALAEMAQNSRVGSEELQRYTTVAMDFEKVTGTAVSKTAEAFASLAKEPLQAAIKLNDGVNWLTTSTYEHIRSLEEQGRKTDAARVAQEAYANSIAQKTAQLQGNLGALERGWNSLAGAAKSAWSAMLNIGRKETLGEQLESARKQLADAERQANIRSAGAFGTFQVGQEPSNRAAIDALKQKIALLSEQERMLKRGAEAQAAANAQVQARIALDSKYGDKLKTDQQKAKAARDEIAELGKAAGKSAEEIKRLQDASDATFNRGGGGGRKGGGAGRTSAAPGENEIARIKAMIEEEQRYIAALQERGKEAEKLTAGEKLVLKLQQELQTSVSGAAKASKEKALAAAQELVAVEKTRIAEEKRIKTDEETRKRLIASIDEERAARMKLAEENAKRVDSLGKENERMREEIETLGMSAAQIAARTIEINNATIAEKENQLARLQNDNISTREMAALEEEIKLLKERNNLLGKRGARTMMVEEAQRYADELKRATEQYEQGLVNAAMQGGKSLEEYIVGTLRAMVIRVVVQPVMAPLAGLFGSFGQAVGLGGGQGGAGGLMGGLNNLGTIGGLAANWLGVGSGAAAGTVAAANAVGALGGDALGALILGNGGWGTIAGTGAAAGAAGSGIAGALSAIPGWGWALGGSLALFGDKMFGRKLKDYGIEGEFGGEAGFEGRNYQFYKGGWFRSDKTKYSELEEQYRTALSRPFIAARDLISSYASTLGRDANVLDDYRFKFKLSLKDKKEDEINQAIAEAIATASNEMAQQIIGSWQVVTDGTNSKLGRRVYVESEYAREGEKAIDTLARLATSLQQVNSAFDTLGHTLLTASPASGDLASRLIDAAGGQEAFGNQTQSYWQNYYTEEERAATIRRQIAEQLGNVGVAMPDTRAAWRALVEETQTRLAAGDESAITLFATLMRLSDAFAAVTPAAESAADAASRLAEEARRLAEEAYNNARSATDAAFNALEKFIGSQRDMWQTALDAAESLIDEARSIFDTAGGAARELWGQQDETRAMLASEGNAAIRQMLDSLRATGALPDADALSRAIDGARGGLDPAAYARTADQEFAQRVLAGQLGEMSELAGGQMTVAEQQAEYARQQIKQLDDTLDYWRKQLDLMRNTDLTVTSIADGIGKLVAAMEEERAAQAALDAARNTPAPSTGNPANAGWAIGGSSGSGGGSGGAYLDYTDFTRHYADGSSALLNMNEVWMALLNSSGGDRAAAEAAYAAEEERRRREGIPSYAVGTDYVPRDMLANIHQGEIIVPAVPAAIIRNLVSNSGDSGQSDALVAEVAALRAEVTALRAERTAADVPLHRMASQFANVTAGGNAMMTEKA